jgi:hypothetical protein
MIKDAAKLAHAGFTDKEIAHFLKIHISTLYLWASEHKEFFDALRTAKDAPDERVRQTLYRKALGYTYEDTKTYFPAGADEPVTVPITVHVPADTTSCIFWLKNRRPNEWRERSEVKQEVITREVAAEARRKLAESLGVPDADTDGDDS